MTSSPGPRIRTPDQRLRVFVSSTLNELAQERHAVQRAVETLRLTPVMFELGARPYPPRALYRAYLEQSHVFLGVYWQSYGWVAPDEEISGLEDEYRLSDGRPRLVYIKGPAPDRQDRLTGLLQRIEADDQASYRHFSSPEELEQLVKDDLMVLLTERFEETGVPREHDVAVRPLAAPPVPVTPTVGRDAEIADVRRLLAEGSRILTLAGPGGVGKSRLALEACLTPMEAFPDGVVFVPLETVDDPAYALRVLADRVGARIEGSQAPLDVAIDHLREQRALLLIDNFEQVLEAGPEVATLLDACPGVSALVTSRRPLRLRGERQLTVQPLGLPPPDDPGVVAGAVDAARRSPAVTLFVERAQRVHPAFEVGAGNVEATVALVRRLDGLPLAIELVAARAHVLDPGQMLERLERGVGVPMAAGQDFPERHRTLRATLEWSHDLLTPSQQTLLARLGVFADGATLEAIESVCAGPPVADLLEDLSVLIDNGLLRADRRRGEGQPRFVLFTIVHEFAAEQLAASPEADDVTARFAEWALDSVAGGDPMLHRDAPNRWPDLQVEVRNLRGAAELLIASGDCDGFTRMAWGMFHWVWRFGHIGVLAQLAERALSTCGGPGGGVDPLVSARLRAAVSWSRFLLGDLTGALEAQAGLDLDEVAAMDPASGALLLNSRSMSLPLTDGGRAAREAAERSLALADSSGFVAVAAYCHAFLGGLDLTNGDLDTAEQHCRTAIAISTQSGLQSLAGQQHAQLALVALARRDLPEARREFATAYDALDVEHHQLDVAFLLAHAAVLATAEGRTTDAARARVVSDALMARFGLPHWHMFEGSRKAALGTATEQNPVAAVPAEPLEEDPWDVLRATLDLPAPSLPSPAR